MSAYDPKRTFSIGLALTQKLWVLVVERHEKVDCRV